MKIEGALAGLLLLTLAPALSAADSPLPDLPSSPLRPHTLGIQFGFKGGTPLSTFSGSTMALKYQQTEHAAWRLGFGASGAARQSDESLHSLVGTYESGERRTKGLNLAGELVRMTYPSPSAPIKPFIGIGPAFAFNRLQDDESQPEGYLQKFSSYDRTWSLGLTAIVGAEWVFLRRVGLHAEYSENGFYQNIRGQAHDQFMTGPPVSSSLRKHSWEFNSGAIRSGLTLYF